MDTIWVIVTGSQEAKALGLNWITAVNIIIALLTVNQAWSTWRQSCVIRESQSVQGVSLTAMTFFAAYFAAMIPYGIEEKMLNVVFVGFQVLIYVHLLLGASKVDGGAHKKLIVGRSLQFLAIPILMIVIPEKDYFLLALLVAIAVMLVRAYRELKTAKNVESVEPKFFWALLVNGIFWTGYAWATDNWPFLVFNPCVIVITILMLNLYYAKKRAMIQV